MVIIDVECYTNYFLLSALHKPSGKMLHFESHNDSPIDLDKINRLMQGNTTVSFNGLGYDLYIIASALTGKTNKQLKTISDKIIKSNLPSYKIAQQLNINVPKHWDHIDLIDVAPGMSSLKIYGARMNAPKLQDLPIEPSDLIQDNQTELMRKYCENDLHTTNMLFDTLEKQIDLRVAMSEQYGVDLRSKSDAQIAETVIKSELEKETGQKYYAPDLDDNYGFYYQNPKIISFQTEQMQKVFDRILKTRFELGANGSVKMPDWLKADKINIGRSSYQMGIGGLHSCEKSQHVVRGDNELLMDLDVASYYPSIILQQRLAPESLGVPFLRVYQSLVTRRLKAKAEGDTVAANTLKIVINGSFGKLGSKWSALYAPDLLIQTTVTGQLALLMLIERLELAGVSVVSANTDGIVIHTSKANESLIEEIAFDWEMSTSYELERTDYKAIASRDVNNYVAVTGYGVKGKGVFAKTGLMKNPDLPIIYEAVAKEVADGTPAAETIRACDDIAKFVSVRKVTGGAVWRDIKLGKTVRFYYSTDVAEDESIRYAKNSNRVPKSAGAKPLLDLPETFPKDVDYNAYITAADKLLCEIGYA